MCVTSQCSDIIVWENAVHYKNLHRRSGLDSVRLVKRINNVENLLVNFSFFLKCSVIQASFASFTKVDQCFDYCDLGGYYINQCCAAYGYRQNGFCSILLGKQVKCENRGRPL